MNEINGQSSSANPLVEALQVFGHSSRRLLRQARGAYTTDLLRWPYREDFAPVWEVVDRIPGWFHEGAAVVLYALMRAVRPDTVVEIGSYLGRSTVFFALTMRQVNPRGRVVAIDPHTGDRQQLEVLSTDRLPTFELFEQHCRAAGVTNVVEAALGQEQRTTRSRRRMRRSRAGIDSAASCTSTTGPPPR